MKKIAQLFRPFTVQAGIERTAKSLEKRLSPDVSVADLKKLAAEARDEATRPNAFTDPMRYRYQAAAYELLAAQKAGQSSFGTK